MELNSSDGIVRSASGSFTGAGASVTTDLGFTAKYIKVLNETDRITHEYYDGMDATKTIKTVAAGTRTLDTGSAIVVDGSSFTIASAVAVSGKQFRVIASA